MSNRLHEGLVFAFRAAASRGIGMSGTEEQLGGWAWLC